MCPRLPKSPTSGNSVQKPKVTQSGNQITATSRMVHRDGGGFALDRSALRITVIGDNQAVDIKGCAAG